MPGGPSRDLPATLFVTTGALHTPGHPAEGGLLPPAEMLSRRQLADFDALGIEIGGHSRTHPQLDTVSRRRLRGHQERGGGQREQVGAEEHLAAVAVGRQQRQRSQREAGHRGAPDPGAADHGEHRQQHHRRGRPPVDPVDHHLVRRGGPEVGEPGGDVGVRRGERPDELAGVGGQVRLRHRGVPHRRHRDRGQQWGRHHPAVAPGHREHGQRADQHQRGELVRADDRGLQYQDHRQPRGQRPRSRAAAVPSRSRHPASRLLLQPPGPRLPPAARGACGACGAGRGGRACGAGEDAPRDRRPRDRGPARASGRLLVEPPVPSSLRRPGRERQP